MPKNSEMVGMVKTKLLLLAGQTGHRECDSEPMSHSIQSKVLNIATTLKRQQAGS